jgi:cytoskeletal protein CcmA (bactofilin family)
MSFFKDFKEDLSQAVNELVPGEDGMTDDMDGEVNTLDVDSLDLQKELDKLGDMLDGSKDEKSAPASLFKTTVQEKKETAKEQPKAETAKEQPKAEPVKEQPKAETAKEQPKAEPVKETAKPQPKNESNINKVQENKKEGSTVEEHVKTETKDTQKDVSDLAKLFQNTQPQNSVPKREAQAPVQATAPKPAPAPAPVHVSAPTPAPTPAPAPAAAVVHQNASGSTQEEAVITKGMRIKGDVESEGSITIEGTITGNVKANGKLVVTGEIDGNTESSEFFADNARMNGEVNSSGTVRVGAGTVIKGNITATSSVIAGAVKGDIDVHGPVIIDTSAVVVGNIKSKSVQINNGAVIEGFCSQCYAEIDMDDLFGKTFGEN